MAGKIGSQPQTNHSTSDIGALPLVPKAIRYQYIPDTITDVIKQLYHARLGGSLEGTSPWACQQNTIEHRYARMRNLVVIYGISLSAVLLKAALEKLKII